MLCSKIGAPDCVQVCGPSTCGPVLIHACRLDHLSQRPLRCGCVATSINRLAGPWSCATVLRHSCPPAQTRGFRALAWTTKSIFANSLKILSTFAMKPSVFGMQLLTAVVGSYQASGCCAPSLPSIPLCPGRLILTWIWSAHSLH